MVFPIFATYKTQMQLMSWYVLVLVLRLVIVDLFQACVSRSSVYETINEDYSYRKYCLGLIFQ